MGILTQHFQVQTHLFRLGPAAVNLRRRLRGDNLSGTALDDSEVLALRVAKTDPVEQKHGDIIVYIIYIYRVYYIHIYILWYIYICLMIYIYIYIHIMIYLLCIYDSIRCLRRGFPLFPLFQVSFHMRFMTCHCEYEDVWGICLFASLTHENKWERLQYIQVWKSICGKKSMEITQKNPRAQAPFPVKIHVVQDIPPCRCW